MATFLHLRVPKLAVLARKGIPVVRLESQHEPDGPLALAAGRGGANDELRAEMIDLAHEDIRNSALLICQLEAPLGAVAAGDVILGGKT